MENTKSKGNKAEAIVLAEFVKNNIPVLLPFGDNEKYDLVFEFGGTFRSVQVEYGRVRNGCVIADIRHRIGFKRIKYETYFNKVDFIAVWCEYNDKVYLLPIKELGDKIEARLRLDPPLNNASISTVCWAKQFEFNLVLSRIL